MSSGMTIVEAMANGKERVAPTDWNEIVKPVVEKKKKVIKCSCDELEDMEEANKMCPKHEQRDAFALWGDATHCSDGVNHFNVTCQGTESGPCSFCSEEDVKTLEPSPPKAQKFAQATGFDVNDCEGEEETPKKVLAYDCEWCAWDPCIVDDLEVREEGKAIVDNLNAQVKMGVAVQCKSHRFALHRMYARFLGYEEKRCILPVCVQSHVDKHFVAPGGEERTGFKAG